MLDNHGKLAVAEIVAYAPAILFCVFNNFYHGFRREAGWIYLTLFCGVRLAGASTILYIEDYSATGVLPTAAVLNTIALSTLMGATLSFLNPHMKSGRRHNAAIANTSLPKLLRPLHIVIIVALALGILGSLNLTNASSSPSAIESGATMLKVSSLLFLILWCILAVATPLYWANRSDLDATESVLLKAVTLAMPFLLVRTIYTGLNAINVNTPDSLGHTTKFSPIAGDWVYYFTLALCMEYIIVLLYAGAGITIYLRTRKVAKREETLYGR